MYSYISQSLADGKDWLKAKASNPEVVVAFYHILSEEMKKHNWEDFDGCEKGKAKAPASKIVCWDEVAVAAYKEGKGDYIFRLGMYV